MAIRAFDAVVVGGGPAGSTCARQLVRRGFDVAIIDKAAFPRDKVCAGWITPGVVAALELDSEAYGQGRTWQPITAFRTGMIDGDEHEIRYPQVVSYGIRRCEFDTYLLDRAGAQLEAGQGLWSLSRQGSLWRLNEEIVTPLLIGAGGHFCPVARHLGARVGADAPAVVAKEVEFRLTAGQREACRVREDTPELYFCRDLKGYGWCFRKGDYLNVGLGREDSHQLSHHLAGFRAFLEHRGKLPPALTQAFHGHAYGLWGHATRRLYDDGVLLVGDAAGLAWPQSGEGIGPAVESGLIAAEVIAAAGGIYRRERLAGYPRQLEARFGRPSAPGPALVSQDLRRALGRALVNNRWFSRHVVLNRWFLHAGQEKRPVAGGEPRA